ncbi:MAG: hypothetical protein QOK39_1614, partial [Acidimicrobiaceae bacterium]|nr:hypothetical protein [Acidimicrobiaceae bacterium]
MAIGQQCVTGDGQHVVVVVAARSAANDPSGLAVGATAYAIDIATAQVTLLQHGTSLAYFNPGCGAGDDFALTSYGRDQATTTVSWGRAGVGPLGARTMDGEITSAIPTTGGAIAVSGQTLLPIGSARLRPAENVALAGRPHDLHPDGHGGVDQLVDNTVGTSAVRTDAWNISPTGQRNHIGQAVAGSASILGGHGGNNIFANLVTDQRRRTIRLPAGAAASNYGDVVAQPANPPAATGASAAGRPYVDQAPVLTAPNGTVFSSTFPVAAPAARAAPTATTTAPAGCAVGRNNPAVQVPQPSGAQIDWALQEATQNRLATTKARPAGAFGLGQGPYSPSVDFPIPALRGTPPSGIPPQVMEGIFATESNWDQASFHAPRGLPGNPLIANFYGTDSTSSTINLAAVDCGYGVGQVTTFMSAASTAEPQTVKLRVAVDYAENVAAAEQILANGWNQLADQSITLNGGQPGVVEDWYFALWAYNT